MKFRDCIISARDQGALSAEEADDLIRRYDAHVAAHAGEAVPERAARDALAKDLDAAAARKARLAALTEAKQEDIVAHLRDFRGPDGNPDVYEAAMRLLENFGFAGTSSVAGQAKAIAKLAMADLGAGLLKFERNFYTGMRHAIPLARDVVREILGEASGNPEAKAFGDSVARVYTQLRERFNIAGGEIGHLEGGYLPQKHNALALLKAGFEGWRDYILPRLDLARMRDPRTGGPLTPDRLGEALKASYDAITTDGWAGRTPSLAAQGNGALASQRADQRFLHFKSGDDWLAYNRDFGGGDPIDAILGHITSLSRDVAALEVLGPNPSARVEWLKQVALSEHAKALDGQPSLFRLSNLTTSGEKDAGKVAARRIEDLWTWVRGREVVSQGVAGFASDIRNVLTSAQLGSAVVTAATTDPAIEKAARQALGMSQLALFGDNFKVYFDTLGQLPIVRHVLGPIIDHMTGAPRDQAMRSGLIADEFLHRVGEEARYAGTMDGHFWSRWMADRTLKLSGLDALTEARKSVFQLELQSFLADHSGTALDALPDRLRNKLAGYGFDAAQWDAMRAVELYRPQPGSAGMLRPIDVAGVDRRLAERYVEMILGETERAVPTGTMRSKAYLLHDAPRGTVGSELMQSFTQYKSFGLSLATLSFEAMRQETALGGRGAGANYAGQLLLLTTLGGGLAIQLKNLGKGTDPQNMKDPKFWIAAASTGGGMGIYGDFLFADTSRFGYSLAEQIAGPGVGLASDIMKFTTGNLWQLAQNEARPDKAKDTNVGNEAVQLLGRYTPVVSSLWYTRLAYRRELLDQLQYQIDPKASRRWRAEQQKAMNEKGQGFWWKPGDTLPDRSPDISRAWPQ